MENVKEKFGSIVLIIISVLMACLVYLKVNEIPDQYEIADLYVDTYSFVKYENKKTTFLIFENDEKTLRINIESGWLPPKLLGKFKWMAGKDYFFNVGVDENNDLYYLELIKDEDNQPNSRRKAATTLLTPFLVFDNFHKRQKWLSYSTIIMLSYMTLFSVYGAIELWGRKKKKEAFKKHFCLILDNMRKGLSSDSLVFKRSTFYSYSISLVLVFIILVLISFHIPGEVGFQKNSLIFIWLTLPLALFCIWVTFSPS